MSGTVDWLRSHVKGRLQRRICTNSLARQRKWKCCSVNPTMCHHRHRHRQQTATSHFDTNNESSSFDPAADKMQRPCLEESERKLRSSSRSTQTNADLDTQSARAVKTVLGRARSTIHSHKLMSSTTAHDATSTLVKQSPETSALESGDKTRRHMHTSRSQCDNKEATQRT